MSFAAFLGVKLPYVTTIHITSDLEEAGKPVVCGGELDKRHSRVVVFGNDRQGPTPVSPIKCKGKYKGRNEVDHMTCV